jgi:hypothetical protein
MAVGAIHHQAAQKLEQMEVTVVVRESERLRLTTMLDEVSGLGLSAGPSNEERSNWRDESCSDEELEDDDCEVGAAGAVELVTI